MRSCCQNRIELFRHPTPYSQYSSVINQTCTAIARRLIDVDTVGLRLCNSCWYARQLLDILQSVMNAAADWFSLSGSTIMSFHFCAIFTGCVHRRESNTVWRCWRSVVNMEWLYHTFHRNSGVRLTLFRTTPAVVNDSTGRAYNDEAFYDRRPCVWSCGCTRMEWSVATCQLLPSQCRCLIAEETWKRSSFCAPIKTFSCIVVFRRLCCVFIIHIFLYCDYEVFWIYVSLMPFAFTLHCSFTHTIQASLLRDQLYRGDLGHAQITVLNLKNV